MDQRSIEAYDMPQRVARYDADMDLMHPNRHKMVQAALDVLSFPAEAPLRALDLGIGTGFFTARFLERHPRAELVALDGAEAMIDLARARLGRRAGQVRFRVGDFRRLGELLEGEGPFDVAYSSFALHHLGPADKQAVLKVVIESLRPGGWFLNADIVTSDSPEIEDRFQQLRIEGIVARAAGRDPRFLDTATTRRYLAEMQAAEADQPLTIENDLRILRAAGLLNATIFWLEYREAVLGGTRAGGW